LPPERADSNDWLSYFQENDRQRYLSTLVFIVGVVLFV
jgi:hypothetical protein